MEDQDINKSILVVTNNSKNGTVVPCPFGNCQYDTPVGTHEMVAHSVLENHVGVVHEIGNMNMYRIM